MPSSPPGIATPATVAVTVLVDRFQVVAKLRMFHWQRLTLGIFGALVVISYNLWHAPVTPWLSPACGTALGGLFIGLGAALLWIRSETARRSLHDSEEPPRERILQTVACIGQISNAWLLWSAVGHVLVGVATLLRARLMVPAGSQVLWLALLPTAGLIAYGIFCIPTRARLIALLHEGR